MGSSQVLKLPNCVSLVQEYRLSRLAAGLVPGPVNQSDQQIWTPLHFSSRMGEKKKWLGSEQANIHWAIHQTE